MNYVVKKTFFENKPFYLLGDVYNPHYETEFIFQLFDNLSHSNITVVEIGSGSGIISLCLALKYPDCTFVSYEVSKLAYTNSLINALIYNSSAVFVNRNIYDVSRLNCDLIISNPPYIYTTDISRSISKKSNRYTALNGGADGLECVRKILELNSREVILELGYFEQILALMLHEKYRVVTFFQPIANYQVFFILLRVRQC